MGIPVPCYCTDLKVHYKKHMPESSEDTTLTTSRTQVLIVGAGPPGLMMACQLAIRNIPFRIIDKREQHRGGSGALIVHARSLEILNQMGIADQAIREGIVAGKINIVFNGQKPLTLILNKMGNGLTKFPGLLLIEQSKTEQLL